MHPHAIDIGAVEQRLIGGGVIALDPFDQLILAQELLPRLWFSRGLDPWRGEFRGRFSDRRVGRLV
jgi:hypothetical protein